MTDSTYSRLLKRVVSDPKVLGGEPRIRGTRIHVAVVLDSLAEGLTPAQIVDHERDLGECLGLAGGVHAFFVGVGRDGA